MSTLKTFLEQQHHIRLIRENVRVWLVPTLALGLLGSLLALVRPSIWCARQGMMVRDEIVGEIGAFIFNIEGRPCAEEYANRLVGLTLPELKRIPFFVGVAATAVKALPLYGALRGGYLNALVTDEAAARGILDLFEKDFRGGSRLGKD